MFQIRLLCLFIFATGFLIAKSARCEDTFLPNGDDLSLVWRDWNEKSKYCFAGCRKVVQILGKDGKAKSISSSILQEDNSLLKLWSEESRGGVSSEYCTINSPVYFARLKRDSSTDTWELIEIVREEEFSANKRDLYRSTVQMLPSGIKELELLASTSFEAKVLESESTLDGGQIVECKLSDSGKNSVYVFRLAERYGWMPVSVSYVASDHTRQSTFTDYVAENGIWMWKHSEMRNVTNSGELLSTVVVDFDFNVAPKSPETSECELSHYGLPEPDFAQRQTFSYIYAILGVGFVAVVASIIIKLKLKG